MQRLPDEDLRRALRFSAEEEIDQQTVLRLKKEMAEQFREQLVIGTPTNEDEKGLRRLKAQIEAQGQMSDPERMKRLGAAGIPAGR